MKPVDVKDNTYIGSKEWHSSKKVHDNDPKLLAIKLLMLLTM